jgi:mRNA interferase MazF
MSLNFNPDPGMLLMCDFSGGFAPPEMVKKRPVVVISPRRRKGSQLYTVVPLSTVRPHPIEAHHHLLDVESLPGNYATKETWAKCDMVVTVALHRMDRMKVRFERGPRQYITTEIISSDFKAIQAGVRAALGL